MGCDIHMYTEYFEKNKWISGDYFRVELDYDGHENIVELPIYGDRNYVLFSILANVRNTDNIISICEAKGFPYNACKQTRESYEYWIDDAHSASYFTLQELIDFSENTQYSYTIRRYISIEDANLLDTQGIVPQCYCRYINDKKYVERELSLQSPLTPLIELLKQRAKELFYTNDRGFIDKNLASKIRIVFWFDN